MLTSFCDFFSHAVRSHMNDGAVIWVAVSAPAAAPAEKLVGKCMFFFGHRGVDFILCGIRQHFFLNFFQCFSIFRMLPDIVVKATFYCNNPAAKQIPGCGIGCKRKGVCQHNRLINMNIGICCHFHHAKADAFFQGQ